MVKYKEEKTFRSKICEDLEYDNKIRKKK